MPTTASPNIQSIIERRSVTTLFQPIVTLHSRAVLAYEALTRGPAGTPFEAPLDLFAAAREARELARLELVCAEAAVARAAQLGLQAQLFLNVSPDALLAPIDWSARLASVCDHYGIDRARCVLELTEQTLVEDFAAIRTTLGRLRSAGFRFAIDDFGNGYSGLRMWSELKPDFIKIDRYFIGGLDRDAVRLDFVSSIVDLARATGSQLIAEGVETAGECRELVELGVDAVQGFLCGPPEPVPRDAAAATAALPASVASEVGAAEDLVVEREPVPADMRIRDFVARVHAEPKSDAFPVVDREHRPVGIVWRDRFLLTYIKPLHAEVLNKKPISSMMDPAPLIVDAQLRLEQVSRRVTRQARRGFSEWFIVTRGGRYCGLGRSVDLLRHRSRRELREAMQRHPLTGLPGSAPLNREIERLIARGTPFVVAYGDLDDFKPFNDFYGYTRGDQLLLHVAQLLRSVASPRLDVVGHIGGDDFIVVLRSPDWLARLTRATEMFDATITTFYDEQQRVTGGLEVDDRYGERRRFGFSALSLAVADPVGERLASADAVASRLQQRKREAKNVRGSCVVGFDAATRPVETGGTAVATFTFAGQADTCMTRTVAAAFPARARREHPG